MSFVEMGYSAPLTLELEGVQKEGLTVANHVCSSNCFYKHFITP